jgi:serine/threonine protein kinase
LVFTQSNVPGLTLAQRIGDPERPNYISLDEAYQWMIEAAEGLSYLHSLNPSVSYGDIKPDNLIISFDGVKLMDFGHSRTIEEKFVITNGMGAWFYSAPEVLGQSADEPGKRYISSDIYAFGVVFYRVLTGQFPRKSLSEIIATVPFPRPCDLNSAIPPELDEIIIRCLEKRPEDRFINASELVAALKIAKSKQRKAPSKEQPGNATVCAKIGFAYLQDSNRRLAIQYFNEALMFDKYEPTALYYMAIIKYLDGRVDKAMQYLDSFRKLDADLAKVKQLEKQLGVR